MPKQPDHTQRTSRLLFELYNGFSEKVERFNTFTNTRHDLFGVFDVLHVGREITGVQICARSGFAAHRRTIVNSEKAKGFLEAGGEIIIIDWRKAPVIKKDGTKGKALRWEPRITEIKIEDMEC